MKVLVVGGGGRENALSSSISLSPLLKELYVTPGNAGIHKIGEAVPIKAEDIESLLKFAKDKKIDLVVVGPEVPIVKGIRNIFEGEGINVFAPRKEVSFLEGSKVRAKEILKKYGIPTAEHRSFSNFEEAKNYIEKIDGPYVIKADGLAAGKGVSILERRDDAIKTLEEYMIYGKFGESSKKVVIEEYLEGKELSVFVVSDGNTWKFIGDAKDYKRVFDNDRGPNTGGMGSISPVPFIDDKRREIIFEKIVEPTFYALRRENLRYEGVLYFGLIWTDKGPMVLEYNVRFGDPETQVLVLRYDFDILELFMRTVKGELKGFDPKLKENYAVTVILASKGYPGKYERGYEISGIDEAEKLDGVIVFHAGTVIKDGKILTNGGRVLNVCGVGRTLTEARERAYRGVKEIKFDGMHYRKDIGLR
jgi:phosphoribosylamine--glycine ligase